MQLVSYLLLFILASACAADNTKITTFEEVDKESCMSSIVPDLSTEFDLLDVFRSCTTIDAGDQKSQPILNTNAITYFWKMADGTKGIIQVSDRKVIAKRYFVNKGLPIGELLTKYGQPEFVARGEVFNPDLCIADVWLLYPSQGFEAGIIRQYECGRDLDVGPNLNVTYYRQFAPKSLDATLRTVHLFNEEVIMRVKAELRPWTGYDSIKRRIAK